MIIIDIDITNLKDINLFNTSKDVLTSISNLIKKKSSFCDNFIIDRFEENIAVCENLKTKEILEVPLSKLPRNAKANDVLTKKDNLFYIDKEKTQSRKSDILELTKDIFENK